MDIGSNSQAELARRAARLDAILDEVAAKQAEAKDLLDDAKNDGFDVAILKKVVSERRKGPEFQERQLTAEAIVETYRRALGLPTTLEDAQQAVRAHTEALPDGDPDHDRLDPDADGRDVLDDISARVHSNRRRRKED